MLLSGLCYTLLGVGGFGPGGPDAQLAGQVLAVQRVALLIQCFPKGLSLLQRHTLHMLVGILQLSMATPTQICPSVACLASGSAELNPIREAHGRRHAIAKLTGMLFPLSYFVTQTRDVILQLLCLVTEALRVDASFLGMHSRLFKHRRPGGLLTIVGAATSTRLCMRAGRRWHFACRRARTTACTSIVMATYTAGGTPPLMILAYAPQQIKN
jgi:hypothetical protein